MEAIKEDLKNIFGGRAAPVTVSEVVSPDAAEFTPLVKRNLCYIVGTVLLDENKVLLVQEAKKSCFGSWYLPAGRVEPNETLIDAAKREVKEEAGYECEITSLVSVEFGCATWWRFNFIGVVTGGELKSLAKKDAESLQAHWFELEEIHRRRIDLRARDMLKVIDTAMSYRARQSSSKPLPCILPVPQAHKSLFHRIALVAIPTDSNAHLLMKKTDAGLHLPTMMLGPSCRTLQDSMDCLLVTALGITIDKPARMCGLLSLEFNGVPKFEHDGICLSSLHKIDMLEGRPLLQPENKDYTWCPVEDPIILALLRNRIDASNNIVVQYLHG